MMSYKGYAAQVEFDPEDKVLHGRVIGIRDVVTFEADSAAKVEKAFRASVDDYLAFCAERGESPDQPASGRFVLRVAPELHSRAAVLAEARGTSLNGLIEGLILAAVDDQLPRAPGPRRAVQPRTAPRKL